MRLIDADYLKTWFGEKDIYTYDYIIGTIDDAPTVKPEEKLFAEIKIDKEDIEDLVAEKVEEIKELLPQKGKWICTDDDIFNCSECDFEIDATGCIDPMEYLKTYNFCPNCGAKMEVEHG